MEYEQSFNTNGSEIVSDLFVNNTSNLIDSEGSFYQQNIPADLAGRGCTNVSNEWTGWKYKTISGNESKMFKESGVGYPLYPGTADTFHYTIPTNKVVGWETVTANMVAPAGTVDFPYKVPLTRSTTTTNAISPNVELGVLVDSGLATNGSSRAEFEAASVQDDNTNGRPDVIDWLIGGDTNYAGDPDVMITQTTNGNMKVSWSPNVADRTYTVSRSTNLVEGVGLEDIGTVTNDSGYVVDTNEWESAFYKVEVAVPQ